MDAKLSKAALVLLEALPPGHIANALHGCGYLNRICEWVKEEWEGSEICNQTPKLLSLRTSNISSKVNDLCNSKNSPGFRTNYSNSICSVCLWIRFVLCYGLCLDVPPEPHALIGGYPRAYLHGPVHYDPEACPLE